MYVQLHDTPPHYIEPQDESHCPTRFELMAKELIENTFPKNKFETNRRVGPFDPFLVDGKHKIAVDVVRKIDCRDDERVIKIRYLNGRRRR